MVLHRRNLPLYSALLAVTPGLKVADPNGDPWTPESPPAWRSRLDRPCTAWCRLGVLPDPAQRLHDSSHDPRSLHPSYRRIGLMIGGMRTQALSVFILFPSSTGDGLVVSIRAADNATAREVFARAERLRLESAPPTR